MKPIINFVAFSVISALIAYFFDLSFFHVFVIVSLSFLMVFVFLNSVAILKLGEGVQDIRSEISALESQVEGIRDDISSACNQ